MLTLAHARVLMPSGERMCWVVVPAGEPIREPYPAGAALGIGRSPEVAIERTLQRLRAVLIGQYLEGVDAVPASSGLDWEAQAAEDSSDGL